MGQINGKITGANRRLAKKRVQCLNEALCFVSSSVLADSLVLRNPLLRQAPKRYPQAEKNIAQQIMTKNLYLNLSIAVVILLLGYYYSYVTDDFWTSRIIGISTSIVSGFTLIGFNHKNLPKKQKEPIKAIQLIAIVIGFSGLILFINYFGYLIYSFLDWELETQIGPNENELLRYLILLVIWVFKEEIFYRRIIAQKIFNEKGFSKALWISSLIFSIGHWFSDTGMLYAFIGGIILAYIYLKTKSIWLSIFAHMYFNLMTFFVTSVIIRYESEINTKPKMIGMILIGVFFVSIMVFLIKKSTENQLERRKPVGNIVYKK